MSHPLTAPGRAVPTRPFPAIEIRGPRRPAAIAGLIAALALLTWVPVVLTGVALASVLGAWAAVAVVLAPVACGLWMAAARVDRTHPAG